MNGRMQEIQQDLEKDKAHRVEMVSFSIAPEMDTPPVLTKYAARFHAETGRWFFLTGDRDAIYHVAHDVFMLPVLKTDPNAKEPDQGEYIHTTKIAVVDPQGVVRGYYDSTDPEIVQRVLTDVGNLLRESQRRVRSKARAYFATRHPSLARRCPACDEVSQHDENRFLPPAARCLDPGDHDDFLPAGRAGVPGLPAGEHRERESGAERNQSRLRLRRALHARGGVQRARRARLHDVPFVPDHRGARHAGRGASR